RGGGRPSAVVDEDDLAFRIVGTVLAQPADSCRDGFLSALATGHHGGDSFRQPRCLALTIDVLSRDDEHHLLDLGYRDHCVHSPGKKRPPPDPCLELVDAVHPTALASRHYNGRETRFAHPGRQSTRGWANTIRPA